VYSVHGESLKPRILKWVSEKYAVIISFGLIWLMIRFRGRVF
jgi:hypothetical protein